MKKAFLLGFIHSLCFLLPPGIHVQQSIIPDIYIYEHISGNSLVSAFTKHMINISLLKNKNLSSAVGDQFRQRYNLCFGGYFYDGIYDRKRPPELPWVGGSFTMSQESLQNELHDSVNIIERRQESNFSLNKLWNHFFGGKKEKKTGSKQTRRAGVR